MTLFIKAPVDFGRAYEEYKVQQRNNEKPKLYHLAASKFDNGKEIWVQVDASHAVPPNVEIVARALGVERDGALHPTRFYAQLGYPHPENFVHSDAAQAQSAPPMDGWQIDIRRKNGDLELHNVNHLCDTIKVAADGSLLISTNVGTRAAYAPGQWRSARAKRAPRVAE